MKKKLLLLLVTALLLVPWTVAYAYDDAAGATGPVSITSPESDSLPQFNACGNAIGGVIPGDIFFIDSSKSAVDTRFTLYITNTDELVHDFRYMTLNIGVYVQNETGGWEKISAAAGCCSGEIFLTMQNGAVDLTLAGNAKYKITIEKGCYFRYAVSGGGTCALPDFYLTTNR